jgi:hypothetical protein
MPSPEAHLPTESPNGLRLTGDGTAGVRCSDALRIQPLVKFRPIRILTAAIFSLARTSRRSLELDDQHVRIRRTNILANV